MRGSDGWIQWVCAEHLPSSMRFAEPERARKMLWAAEQPLQPQQSL